MATKIEWRPIPSFLKYRVNNIGEVENISTGYRLKPIKRRKSGHLFFYPQRGVKCYIHRAVLEAFVGIRPTGMQCRHLDGNPQNNNLDNLKWGTPYENAQDTKKHKRKPKGEDASFSTMSNKDAEKVRLLHKEGFSSRIIAKKFGVSHTTIQKITRKERYV